MRGSLIFSVRRCGVAALTGKTAALTLNRLLVRKGQVEALDPSQLISNVSTLVQRVAISVAARRFIFILLTLFAVAALALTIVGIYGVMSYFVTRNIREIGIRIALGATRNDVLRLIVGQGMVLTLTGMMIGLTATFALTRMMAHLLYAVSPTDAFIFVAVFVILVGVALTACFVLLFEPRK